MEITVTVPDEPAVRLQSVEKELPQILELGMRAWTTQSLSEFSSLNDVLETLASLPKPEEILALRPSPALQQRIEELVEKNHGGSLSVEEQRAWDQYEYVEHLVRLAKSRAGSTRKPDR
jgi:hypothetical protein